MDLRLTGGRLEAAEAVKEAVKAAKRGKLVGEGLGDFGTSAAGGLCFLKSSGRTGA